MSELAADRSVVTLVDWENVVNGVLRLGVATSPVAVCRALVEALPGCRCDHGAAAERTVEFHAHVLAPSKYDVKVLRGVPAEATRPRVNKGGVGSKNLADVAMVLSAVRAAYERDPRACLQFVSDDADIALAAAHFGERAESWGICCDLLLVGRRATQADAHALEDALKRALPSPVLDHGPWNHWDRCAWVLLRLARGQRYSSRSDKPARLEAFRSEVPWRGGGFEAPGPEAPWGEVELLDGAVAALGRLTMSQGVMTRAEVEKVLTERLFTQDRPLDDVGQVLQALLLSDLLRTLPEDRFEVPLPWVEGLFFPAYRLLARLLWRGGRADEAYLAAVHRDKFIRPAAAEYNRASWEAAADMSFQAAVAILKGRAVIRRTGAAGKSWELHDGRAKMRAVAQRAIDTAVAAAEGGRSQAQMREAIAAEGLPVMSPDRWLACLKQAGCLQRDRLADRWQAGPRT